METQKNSQLCKSKLLTKAGILMNAGLLSVFVFLSMLLFTDYAYAAGRNQCLDTGDSIILMIDAGHGGTNLGAECGILTENKINLITAQAMYDELTTYEGITCYMTRFEDTELTLTERAEFAKQVSADMLVSIHYNASDDHNYYGAEAWVSGYAPYNAYGYQLAEVWLNQVTEEYGIFNRGVKTRYLPDADADYYGIIRDSVKRGIPAIIIEHAHLDNSKDLSFVDEESDFISFGKSDATAIAKYFGLKKKDGSADYSDYNLTYVDSNSLVEFTLRDESKPDYCGIELIETDAYAGKAVLKVTGYDRDSFLQYYSVSTDGGATFSQFEDWPGHNVFARECDDSFYITVDLAGTVNPDIVVRAYNSYDVFSQSKSIMLEFDFTEELKEAETEPFDAAAYVTDKLSEREEIIEPEQMRKIILFGLAIAFIIVFILAVYGKNRKD